jgi:hypothetical protein
MRRLLLFLAAAILTMCAAFTASRLRSEEVPCFAMALVPPPHASPWAFPVVATPGTVRDLGGAVPEAFRFERDLGSFAMRYDLSPPARDWGIGRTSVRDTRACDASDVRVDVPARSSDVRLRQAGDVYLLTADAGRGPLLAFRSIASGSRRAWRGLGPASVAAAAAVLFSAAVFLTELVRRRVTRLATWTEGTVGPTATILSRYGAHFARGRLPAQGVDVLFARPTGSSAYRSSDATVDVVQGSRATLELWERRWRARLDGLIVVATILSALAALTAAIS